MTIRVPSYADFLRHKARNRKPVQKPHAFFLDFDSIPLDKVFHGKIDDPFGLSQIPMATFFGSPAYIVDMKDRGLMQGHVLRKPYNESELEAIALRFDRPYHSISFSVQQSRLDHSEPKLYIITWSTTDWDQDFDDSMSHPFQLGQETVTIDAQHLDNRSSEIGAIAIYTNGFHLSIDNLIVI